MPRKISQATQDKKMQQLRTYCEEYNRKEKEAIMNFHTVDSKVESSMEWYMEVKQVTSPNVDCFIQMLVNHMKQHCTNNQIKTFFSIEISETKDARNSYKELSKQDKEKILINATKKYRKHMA